MPPRRRVAAFDVVELKTQLFKKLGRQKAEKYFHHLKRLLSLKLSKIEFDKLCRATIGRENVALHNLLIRSILENAVLGATSAQVINAQAPTGHSGTNRTQLTELPTPSPRNARSFADADRIARADPPGAGGSVSFDDGAPLKHAKEVINSCDVPRSQQPTGALDQRSNGSKVPLEVLSVEDGEEVEQGRASPYVQSRSPIVGPLGMSKVAALTPSKAARAARSITYAPSPSCYVNRHLPDTSSLCADLERRLEAEGLGVSADSAGTLNAGLDAYLTALIKPCIDLAQSRTGKRRSLGPNVGNVLANINGVWQYNRVVELRQEYCGSLQDFLAAVESNPRLLGSRWPLQLEKITQFDRNGD